MKPFALINLSSAALRTGILVSSLALAAGCVDVVTVGELIEKTRCDQANSAHWLYYCGDSDGLMYFREESVSPIPAKVYAVKAEEFPPVMRFPRTDDKSKWKVVSLERSKWTFEDDFYFPVEGVVVKRWGDLSLNSPLAGNDKRLSVEDAIKAFRDHARTVQKSSQDSDGDDGFNDDDGVDISEGAEGFISLKKESAPTGATLMSIEFERVKGLWRVEYGAFQHIGYSVVRDDTSTTTTPVLTNLVIVATIDASGKVNEQSRQAVPPFHSGDVPIDSLLSYCKAKGIVMEKVRGLWSRSADEGSDSGVIDLGDRILHVSWKDVMKAEKELFLSTIASADKVVIRKGGYDCCKKSVDGDIVLLTITNAADIAAFNEMFQLDDDSNSDCFCCGFPGIDWWRDGERIALTGIQHCQAIRWRGFSMGDRHLTGKAASELSDWLSRRSITK